MKRGELITIIRTERNTKQTTGEGFITDVANEVLFNFKTLELAWKNNKVGISCIPPGLYVIEKRYSRKFGWHLHITNVEGRTWILIHPGNFYTQIRGCVLPGLAFKDINGDGLKDVIDSVPAMNKIMELMPAKAKLRIIDKL